MSTVDQTMGSELEGLQAIFSDLQRSPLLDKFVSLWHDMGIEGSNLVTRQDAIRLHIHNLMEDMYKEELVLKEKLIDSVAQCTLELTELCSQLSVPFNGPSEALPLATREKELRQKVDTLTKEKHNRLKRLKRLAELESAMCKCVGEQTQLGPVMQSGAVPSDKDLQTYREMVARLEQTKNERQEDFLSVRKKVLKLWEEMEVQPHQEFERHVASGDINHFGLSVENMAKLHKFHTELEEEAVHLEARAHQLRESINSLWQRLEVPQKERDVFTQKYLGHKPKIIAALCEEMSRLDEMKKEHMQKFVEATRAELRVVWDQCMYGPQQRQEFVAAFSGNFSEELLSAHESELDRMKGFYQDNLEVFQLIQKREKLWRQQLEMDKQATDPNRFNNRGGQLQKQLKLRNQLERELPKMGKELKSMLLQWEEDHGRHFLVEDSRYIDAVEAQMKMRFQEKEEKKIKKKQNKEEVLKFEMTYGSRPCTPVKSAKRRAGGTPTGGNCKQRRIGTSPVSSVRTTLKRAASKRPGLPTPAGRKKLASSRRILTERNGGVNPEESVFTQANMSLASTGSYTDFQQGLLAGMESQKSARSSAIPKSSSAQNLAPKK